MKRLKKTAALTVFSLCAISISSLAAAQANEAIWPQKQIHLIVPYPPGTEPDVMARDIGQQINQKTGKVVVVENKPGANAIIGTDYVARSKADGYTLLVVDRLALETNPYLYTKLSYDWKKDLAPVANLARVNLYLSLRKDFPANTFNEFIDYTKSHGGEINVATGGRGHVTHLGMASLAKAEGLNFTYVPYRGVGPAVNSILAGETDAIIAGGLVTSQQAKGNNVKVIAVGTKERTELMPDVPTVGQAGGADPNSIPSTTFSLIAPGGTPDNVLQAINATVNDVLQEPKLLESYKARGLIVSPVSVSQAKQEMLDEAESYKKIIDALGIKPE